MAPNKWVVWKLPIQIPPKLQALLIQHACLISVARPAVETPEIPIDPRYLIGVTQIGLELRTGCPDFFEQFFVSCDGGGCLAGIGVVVGKRTQSGIDLLTRQDAL